MIKFQKSSLDAIAKKEGFIRDNLEKVLRLVEILRYFHNDELLSKSLVLKGGTAINLTVFEMPRLSVDIDLDYAINCSREEMLSAREEINDMVLRYMEIEGYTLSPVTKNPHSLDSWVFYYTNAGGNNDVIKIEINYSNRCHVLPLVERNVSIDFIGDVSVNVLSPLELFASKINALVGRNAMRDIYDVNNMIQNGLFASPEKRDTLRKTLAFYLAVGSNFDGNIPFEFKTFPKIESINFHQVRTQLIPVLRKTEKFDFMKAKQVVGDWLKDFLQFTDEEKRFIMLFNSGEFHPEILFGNSEITDRIKNHPMALWKCRK